MSRAKQLRELPKHNLNLFDMFSMFVPERKTKYVETFLRILANTPKIDEYCTNIKKYYNRNFNIDHKQMDELDNIQVVTFFKIVEVLFKEDDIKKFQKFCELNERGLIKQNDLTLYTDFGQIKDSLDVAEINAIGKELEKQIIVIFEDDEWILLKPLTYLSSKKYGSNTKWCTTSSNDSSHFTRYTSKGILIYCVNKKTGYKVACFYSLDKNDPEFSFWDQEDKRIDSMQTELTEDLKLIILKEVNSPNKKTNRFLLSDEVRTQDDEYMYKVDVSSEEVREEITLTSEHLDFSPYVHSYDTTTNYNLLVNSELTAENVTNIVSGSTTTNYQIPARG